MKRVLTVVLLLFVVTAFCNAETSVKTSVFLTPTPVDHAETPQIYFLNSWSGITIALEPTLIAVFIIITAFVAVTYFLVNYSVRKAINVERIKEEVNAKLRDEIGRDFHDEMGNRLARIISYISLARLNNKDPLQTLLKIEDATKEIISGSKDFIWALNPINDNVSSLYAHVRDFGQNFFKDSSTEFRTYYEDKENLMLDYGTGRQLNLILKEALTNVFKHAQAKATSIEFNIHANRLVVKVVDDGVGIEEGLVEHSDGGVSNMFYRAKKIGADLSLKNQEGMGTVLELLIEIKRK